MSKAYFAPLVTLPVIITKLGKYVTRKGEIIEITRVSTKHDFGCLGKYPGPYTDMWHKSGRLYGGMQTENDIVGELPA